MRLLDVVSFCKCMIHTCFVLGSRMRNLLGPVDIYPFVAFEFVFVGSIADVCV